MYKIWRRYLRFLVALYILKSLRKDHSHSSRMPFYNKKTEPAAESKVGIVDFSDEGFVKVVFKPKLDATEGGNGQEVSMIMTAMSASEFLAEIDRLPILPVRKKRQDCHKSNIEDAKNEDETKAADAVTEPGPSNALPICRWDSSDSSWDSQLGELAYNSDDSLWGSFISTRSQPGEQPSNDHPDGQKNMSTKAGKSTLVSFSEWHCDHKQSCGHGSRMACSECCTCISNTWVFSRRLLKERYSAPLLGAAIETRVSRTAENLTSLTLTNKTPKKDNEQYVSLPTLTPTSYR
jgi:hypothetical protein